MESTSGPETALSFDEADLLVRSPRRLAAVRSTALLDTEPEEEFDALTRLAKTTLAAAASFVSLVDVDRDFYKSQAGFPVSLAVAREMSGRTFCHYALANTAPLVIEDTHAEPVWKAVPTVESLGVRAYVGAPIVLDGQPIGSFCVIDGKPRAWRPEEVEIVVQLARSAEREIRLRAALAGSEAEAERLRSSARRNEELLAVVAHDLRSPLQAIALTAAMLARSGDASVRDHGNRVELAASAMRSLVDDLLTSETTRSSDPQRRQHITVNKLLGDATQTMAPIAQRAGISLSFEAVEGTAVTVDYAQILRALCNVIGNAIKYCPRCTVRLGATREAGSVRLTVVDDGPGIPADELAQVFDRGFQASNATALGQGFGLGLSIVRSLAESNGGSAEIDSVQGRGTSVSIILPC